ncbi:hypothetical protein Q1695_002017 [Nippostrongylus brasiliensis]|nr:hypothetical protein Q1695_002017 [Nippostrongylus brasiliensis]
MFEEPKNPVRMTASTTITPWLEGLSPRHKISTSTAQVADSIGLKDAASIIQNCIDTAISQATLKIYRRVYVMFVWIFWISVYVMIPLSSLEYSSVIPKDVNFIMSSVTVLCPNARRCPVKVTPGMLMRQVLEEACLRHGFEADEYQLQNQKRHVDLALPFRLSGLPNNATLEMVQAAKVALDSKVTIALQLPSGSRLEEEFPVSSTLFEVLQRFSQSGGEDLTVCGDSLAPSCSYMNRQYTGPLELQRTTLASIGILSGKCLIRYQRIALSKEQLDEIAARIASESAHKEAMLAAYAEKKAENEAREKLEAARLARFEEELRLEKERKSAEAATEEPMETDNQPAQSTAPVFSRDLLGSPPRNNSGWSFDAPVFSTAPVSQHAREDRLSTLNRLLHQVDTSLSSPNPETDRITNILAERGRIPLSRIAVEASRIEQENEAAATVAAVAAGPVAPCERRAVIFQRQSDGQAENELSDEFFEVRVDDLKVRQKELREEVKLTTQRALVPSKYIKQKNRERKLAAYPHTVIRLPLGNEKVVQLQFLSAEPVSRLFEWIRNTTSRNAQFTLSLVNLKIKESDTENFVDADLAPKSTVLVKFKDSSSFESHLQKDALKECSQDEANRMSSEWLSHNTVFKPYTAVVEEDERTTKRPASTMPGASSDIAPPPQKATAAPRWLKKK